MAAKGSIELALPAFSLAEPYHTLGGRHIQRQELSQRLDRELHQLSRSAPLAEPTQLHREAVNFLTRVGEDEVNRHRKAVESLLGSARLLSLDRPVIERSWVIEAEHGLDGPDAIVLASVLMDLEKAAAKNAVFLNRNAKDFEDPDIEKLLADRGCKLITNFRDGLARVEASLRGGLSA